MKNLEEFKNLRKISESQKKIFCYSPYLNLDFDQLGRVTACCYSRDYELGRYPANSLIEIWNGEPIKKLREKMKTIPTAVGCNQCIRYIEEKNFASVQVNKFDYLVNSDWLKHNKLINNLDISNSENILPRSIGLHLSNVCNLECIMCGGAWSSQVRKNREKLPPLPYPYDEKFFNELKSFLPFLFKIDFLGGEPFLLNDYFKLWDEIIEHEYLCRVSITTNGTIMNSKVEKVLREIKNLDLVISCDSLNPENYEKIRINSKFKKLEENLKTIKLIFDERRSKKLTTFITFAVCPMPINYMDIPNLIYYCIENGFSIHFNTVNGPLSKINNTYQDLAFKDKDLEFLHNVNRLYMEHIANIQKNFSHAEKCISELISLNSLIESIIKQKTVLSSAEKNS
jgi:MoaA/NifB/PqqE/SkfB family radical SAM enzyme